MSHPALSPNRTAVITGGASGIGFAVAERLAAADLNVCIADLDESALDGAADALAAQAPRGADAILAFPTDVSRIESVEALRKAALDRSGIRASDAQVRVRARKLTTKSIGLLYYRRPVSRDPKSVLRIPILDTRHLDEIDESTVRRDFLLAP